MYAMAKQVTLNVYRPAAFQEGGIEGRAEGGGEGGVALPLEGIEGERARALCPHQQSMPTPTPGAPWEQYHLLPFAATPDAGHTRLRRYTPPSLADQKAFSLRNSADLCPVKVMWASKGSSQFASSPSHGENYESFIIALQPYPHFLLTPMDHSFSKLVRACALFGLSNI